MYAQGCRKEFAVIIWVVFRWLKEVRRTMMPGDDAET